ncbi:MAG: hypothetical protein ABL930_10770 [Pseudobdellovibrio sp.]
MSLNHQEIQTHSNSNYIIRASRFNDPDYLDFQIDNQKFKIINYSTYGLAFLSDNEYSLNTVITDCKLNVYGNVFHEFACIVRRSKATAGNKYEVGIELINQEIDISSLNSMVEIQTKISEIYEKEDRYSAVPQLIKSHVQNLKWKLHHIEKIAKSVQSIHYENVKSKTAKFENTINQLGPCIYNELKNINSDIQQIFMSLDSSTQKLSLEYYREHISEYVTQSNFTKRSLEKPRGYAGDFEMMNQLYRNDNFSNTLFGSCVERAVNLHDEPTAVRNRAHYLKDKIVTKIKNTNDRIKILAVACGPAEELKQSISQLSQSELDRVDFYLLDQDIDALLYAQQNIKSHFIIEEKKMNLHLVHKSIKDILLAGLDMKFDMIYSAGLFDYFSDAVASRACRALTKNLNKKSSLIIGNFNIASPNWFGMLALFDWYLILRSEEDLKRIFNVQGAQINIEKEPRNVNLFCNLYLE